MEMFAASTGNPCADLTPVRREVWFQSDTERCHAWLYLPQVEDGCAPAPLILMAHGLGGVKCGGLEPFAERFQAAGYACLVFDYRHFGQSSGFPRELLDIGKQREDWHAALAFARTLEHVDIARIVLWGTSFAGGHVIAVGAQDARVAAVIAQCPFTDGFASSFSVSPLTSFKLFVAALRDQMARLAGRTPVRVATAGHAGSAALMTAQDALKGHLAINRASGLSDEPTMVPARVALQIPFDRPGRKAARLSCPALFVLCAHDSVAPAKPSLRHVLKAKNAEVRWLPEGHFTVYLGESFERNVRGQINFLQQQVPVGTAS
jgi:pimeloyl-ACP methyl ester carboxylesterase